MTKTATANAAQRLEAAGKRGLPLYLYVPAIFWDDHADRCPSDDGESGICREVRRAGNRVMVNGTPSQIECLRSDAAFYCDPAGPDECPASIKRSAASTLAAIEAAIAKVEQAA